MEQLSLFNLQRQCLEHPCRQLHLHHVMFTEDSGGQREEALLISLIVALESLERNNSWNIELIQVFGCYLLIFCY